MSIGLDIATNTESVKITYVVEHEFLSGNRWAPWTVSDICRLTDHHDARGRAQPESEQAMRDRVCKRVVARFAQDDAPRLEDLSAREVKRERVTRSSSFHDWRPAR